MENKGPTLGGLKEYVLWSSFTFFQVPETVRGWCNVVILHKVESGIRLLWWDLNCQKWWDKTFFYSRDPLHHVTAEHVYAVSYNEGSSLVYINVHTPRKDFFINQVRMYLNLYLDNIYVGGNLF